MTDIRARLTPDAGAGPEPDRFPLSEHQDLLRSMDHGDGAGPFGPRYTIVGGWRVLGKLDTDILRRALLDVVERHESLRTTITLDPDQPFQTVHGARQPELEIHQLDAAEAGRDDAVERFLNDIEARPYGLEQLPQLKAVLGRFDSADHILVLTAHHTAVDGWSVHRVMQDLATLYAARQAGRPADLPPARQYREYVAWQRDNADSAAVLAARAYWRETLRGSRFVGTPTDLPRSADPFVTGWHRFLLDQDYHDRIVQLAARTRSTPFMVLLAAYLLYLQELTGQSDLVVATFTPGRFPGWVQDIVGAFYNLIPLRTDLTGCTSFEDVIARVRTTCIGAYAHEIPFHYILDEVPDLMDGAIADHSAIAVFQVTQSPHMMLTGADVGDLTYLAIRKRLEPAAVGSQLPDGVLWGLEFSPEGEVLGSIGYTSNVLSEQAVLTMTADFCSVLRDKVLAG